MRAKLLPLVLIFFIISCNQKQPASDAFKAPNDWTGENLKGNPTQVESDTYKIDSTGKMGPLDEKTIEKYDSTGYTLSNVVDEWEGQHKISIQFRAWGRRVYDQHGNNRG